MWAYYVDCYKGVCLQFVLFLFEVMPVRYTPRSFPVSGVDVTRAHLLSKHIDRSHELE